MSVQFALAPCGEGDGGFCAIPGPTAIPSHDGRRTGSVVGWAGSHKSNYECPAELRDCAIAAPGCLDALPKLGAFVARVAALPRIAAYLASERCIARPLNNPHAQFL